MASDGQSSNLLYGPLARLLRPAGSSAVGEPRLIAVIELSDQKTGEIAERIEVDISEAPLPGSWIRIMLRGNASESVTKHLESFARTNEEAEAALHRARTSGYRWTACMLDRESAIAWCDRHGIDLDC
jgi:hypothetical protein